MAITIAVTDGTNTVTLSATDGYNSSYQPVIPDAGAVDVTETLEVKFFGGNATVAANLAELERLFDYARMGQSMLMRRRVWLKVTVDSDVWRSEVYDGKILSTDGWIKYERALGERETSVIIRRAPWWEADAAIYATLFDGINSGSSGGLTFYNHHDSAHNNWADAINITGDIPAPAIVTITESSTPNTEVFLGMATYCDLNNLVLPYELTLNVGAGVTLTVKSDASNYSGSYMELVWSGTSEVTLQTWYPTTAEVTAFAGRVFRPLVRLHSAIGGSTRYWMTIAANYDNAGTLEEIWRSEETLVVLPNKMQILPLLQLPPWPIGDQTSHRYTFNLLIRCEGAGSHTLNIDALQLIPCDSYLRLIPIMTTYPDLNIEFDSQTRMLKNNAAVIETHTAEGTGIWLAPGITNRLVMALRTGAGWVITTAPNVKVQYRPRKRTL